MDKKLLDALNNLSLGLEMLSESLDKNNQSSGSESKTQTTLKEGNFVDQLKEINDSLKEIKADTKTILNKQNTVSEVGKEKEKEKEKEDSKTEDIKKMGKDKEGQNAFVKGLTTIMLLAVAVIAIGAAFKLIGNVNFLSVISLSLAIVILAKAFTEVHTTLKKVEFDPKKDAVNLVLAISSIALSITISSWILSLLSPVGFIQIVTAILIGGLMSIVSISMTKIIHSFKGVGIGEIVKMVLFFPLVFSSISLAIVASSWILGKVIPIGFGQFVTALFISVLFIALSFSMHKIMESFKGIDPVTIAIAAVSIPIILLALTYSIQLSSEHLSKVTPIGFVQVLSAIFISVVFIALSFAAKGIIKSFQGIDPGTAAIAAVSIPLLMISLSAAILGASFFLSKVVDVSGKQFLTSLGISAVFVVLSFGAAMILKSTKNFTPKQALSLPLFFATMSLSIYLSSEILSKVKPIEPDVLGKLTLMALALSISAVAIAGVMWIINKMKLKIKDAFVGMVIIVAVATAIMLSSLILSLGKYEEGKYPSKQWAVGVGLSLLSFVPAILVLGAIGATGFGALVVLAGIGLIEAVSFGIAAASHILNKGNFTGGPTPKWALGVALSLMAFTPLYLMSITTGLLSLVTGVKPDSFKNTVISVSEGIVEAAKSLSKSPGVWVGGPTKDWAEGVSIAIGGFAPVYKMLVAEQIMGLFGKGVSVDSYVLAIKTISKGIVEAAKSLSTGADGKPISWVVGPTKDWSEGVSLAIGSFAPVYKMLTAQKILDIFLGKGAGTSTDEFVKAIGIISGGIKSAATELKGGDYTGGPRIEWSEGVAAAITGFAPVLDFVKRGNLNKKIERMKDGIYAMVQIIKTVGIYFKQSDFSKFPSKDWVQGVSDSVVGFMDITEMLEKRGVKSGFNSPIVNIVKGMVSLSKGYDKLASSLKKLSVSLNGIDLSKLITLNKIGAMTYLQKKEEKTSGYGIVSNAPGNLFEGIKDKLLGNNKRGSFELTKSPNDNVSEKLDKIIKELKNINNSVISVNNFLLEKAGEPTIENKNIGLSSGD